MLEAEWDRLKHLIDGLDDGYTLEDIWHEVGQRRAQFWPLPNSVVVTQILTFPRRKVLRIWLAGGNMDELKFALTRAADFGRANGCTAIELDGRKGWARVLEGFKQTRVVLTKEIE